MGYDSPYSSACLLSVATRYFILILYLPWNRPLPQGVLVPFIGKWYLEIKICVLSVLIVCEMMLLRGPLRTGKWEIHVCRLPMCTHVTMINFIYLYRYSLALYRDPDSGPVQQVHSSLPPFLFGDFLLPTVWETQFSLSIIYLLSFSTLVCTIYGIFLHFHGLM